MSEEGICPICRKGSRKLSLRHPESKEKICSTCYIKAVVKKGTCPECNRKDVSLQYYHPTDRERGNICANCYQKNKRKTRMEEKRKWKKHPGEEVLAQLIRQCGKNYSLISRELFRQKGIEVKGLTVSVWIENSKFLTDLCEEVGIPKKKERVNLGAASKTKRTEFQAEEGEEETEKEDERAAISVKDGDNWQPEAKYRLKSLAGSLQEIFRKYNEVTTKLLREEDRVAYLRLARVIEKSVMFDDMDFFLMAVTKKLRDQEDRKERLREKKDGVPAA